MKKGSLFLKAIVITLCLVAIAAFFLIVVNEKYDEENAYVSTIDVTTKIGDKEYLEKNNIITICVVGLDNYAQVENDAYTNGDLADFIYLLVIDKDNKTITPIHINRDSMVNYHILGIKGDIITDSFGQIALSHSQGNGGLTSLINVRDAVSSLFYDTYIDYVISLTMDAVPKINDKLGGVDVYVDYDFSDLDPSIYYGVVNHLEGYQALTFVRARGALEDKTNLTRMKRQRAYLDALYDKFITVTKNDDDLILSTLNAVKSDMLANASVNEMAALLSEAKNYTLNDTIVLGGEAKKGDTYMEYYIDEEHLEEIAKTYLFEECK